MNLIFFCAFFIELCPNWNCCSGPFVFAFMEADGGNGEIDDDEKGEIDNDEKV